MPAGLFTGKSKQLYDCLYSLTRGAIVPSRTVRISRPKLMKKSGIGARATFDANVERLVAVGLVEVRTIIGEHDGNEYTVLLPDEVSMPSQTSMPSLTKYAQNLDRLVRLETSQTRHTLSPLDSTTSATSKTSFKTIEENDDDEAFAKFRRELKEATKALTGREPSAAEADRWHELAQVLVTELKIAAARTTVSSVPAFLAAHLRRRLFKKEKEQIEKEQNEGREASSPKIEAGKCPDCGGSNFWYPEGYEKGVARCTHEKLKAAE